MIQTQTNIVQRTLIQINILQRALTHYAQNTNKQTLCNCARKMTAAEILKKEMKNSETKRTKTSAFTHKEQVQRNNTAIKKVHNMENKRTISNRKQKEKP